MNEKLSEKEVDNLVIAQVNDEDAWIIEGFKEKVKRGSREKFLKALSKVPKVESEEDNKIN